MHAPSGFWDELPGYSGGTAPEFDRLPSRPLWGATAARLAIALARLRRSPRLVKRGVFGEGSFVLRTCDDERSEISRCERVAVVHGRTACRPWRGGSGILAFRIAKAKVAGSNPVFRSKSLKKPGLIRAFLFPAQKALTCRSGSGSLVA